MREREPGSGARYLEERRRELAEAEAEQRREKQDADDLARFTQEFVKAGGRPENADAAWKAERTRRAAGAATRKEDAATAESRRRFLEVL